MNRLALLISLAVLALPIRARADGEGGGGPDTTQLTRSESVAYKKKLVAILNAMGLPPQGYAKSDEHYDLPTHYSQANGTSNFWLNAGRAELKFGGAGAQQAQQDAQNSQADLQKKILEAQARGDYQTMAQLSQQMSQQAGQYQMQAMQANKPQISVTINSNQSGGPAIDPDLVLFQKPGMIALKNPGQGSETVTVYFDPVSLKDPDKVSAIDLYQPEKGVPSKTSVVNATITLSGPADIVEAWARKIDTAKVLAVFGAN